MERKSDDKVCKVIALDDTVFFNSGNVRVMTLRGKPWESIQTAREIYKVNKNHSAQSLSSAWGEEAMSWFGIQSPLDIRKIMWPDGGLVTGGFINFDADGKPAAFAQALYFNPVTRRLYMQPENQFQIGGTGLHPELVEEFAKAETGRALKAYGNLKPHNVGRNLSYDKEFVAKAVQFVIDNVSGEDKLLVHGPVDVVVVRRARINWGARKRNCYSQDVHSRER